MESKHIKNDRDIKTGTIDEKETVCNRSASNSVFGKSIVVLKKEGIQNISNNKHRWQKKQQSSKNIYVNSGAWTLRYSIFH